MPRWEPSCAVVCLWFALDAAAAPVSIRPVADAQQIDACAMASTSGYAVAWVDARPLGREVRSSFSADGIAWSSAPSLSGPGARDEAMRPGCAARGDEVVVTWASAKGGDHDVYAARSRDGGRSFDPPALVASGPGGQLAPRAAIGADGRAYVVFHDSFGSSDEDEGVVWRVRLSWSARGGAWSPPTTVDRGPGFALFPAVDVSESGRLYVAWLADERVMGTTTIDPSAGFAPPTELANAAVGPPELAASEDGATVVFTASSSAAEQRDPELFVQQSSYLDVRAVRTSTTLAVIEGARAVHTQRRLDQLQPAIAGSRVVWLDHASAGVRRIRARGAEEADVSDNDGAREVAHPSISCAAAGCLIAWSEEGDGGEFDVRAVVVR